MPSLPALARILLAILFAPALTFAQSSVDQDFAARYDAAVERQRARADDIFGSTREHGAALLVIPTINLDAAPRRDFNDQATRDRYVRQRSTFVHWRHKSEKGLAITAGQGEHKPELTDTGPVFQTVRGGLLYQVIPVLPGEYRLNRITYHQPRTKLPETGPSWDYQDRLKKIGIATLNHTMDREFKLTTPLSDQEADDGLGKGCDVMLKNGGGCDEEAREFRWRLGVARAFKQGKAEATPAEAVDVELIFSAVASITLKAGEAVLTDGFVLPADQPEMTPDSCEDTSYGPICSVDSIVLTRLPASLEDFRQAPDAKSFGMPKLDEALRDLVYRAPTLYFEPQSKTAPNVIRVVTTD